MQNKDINPCFRLRMRSESEFDYQSAKAAWEASMRRCGIILTK